MAMLPRRQGPVKMGPKSALFTRYKFENAANPLRRVFGPVFKHLESNRF
jgi:hypothetical protein